MSRVTISSNTMHTVLLSYANDDDDDMKMSMAKLKRNKFRDQVEIYNLKV